MTVAHYNFMNLLGIFQSKGDNFYRWFEEASENNYKAARLLEKLCKNFKDSKKISDQIRNLEHDGDQISHSIYKQLNSVFVTPLDREDIIALTNALDDVIDLINASSSSMVTHNIKSITPSARDFSRIIIESTKLIAQALPKLRSRRAFPQLHKIIIEINRLENEADDLLRKSLTQLFKNPKNPIDVIRWVNIYEIMEDATDRTEDIANILQNLITKYA